MITDAGLIKTVTEIKPYVSEVVWEFWANLPSVKVETDSVEVFVRDRLYEFSAAQINALYGLQSVDARTHQVQTADIIEEDIAMYLSNGKTKTLKNLPLGDFSDDAKDLFKICCSNWAPTTNDGYAQPDRARLVHLIAHNKPFDFGKMAFEHILMIAQKPKSKLYLPFPSLVFQLLQAQHPVKLDEKESVLKTRKLKKTVKKPSAQTVKAGSTAYHKAMRLAIEILQ